MSRRISPNAQPCRSRDPWETLGSLIRWNVEQIRQIGGPRVDIVRHARNLKLLRRMAHHKQRVLRHQVRDVRNPPSEGLPEAVA